MPLVHTCSAFEHDDLLGVAWPRQTISDSADLLLRPMWNGKTSPHSIIMQLQDPVQFLQEFTSSKIQFLNFEQLPLPARHTQFMLVHTLMPSMLLDSASTGLPCAAFATIWGCAFRGDCIGIFTGRWAIAMGKGEYSCLFILEERAICPTALYHWHANARASCWEWDQVCASVSPVLRGQMREWQRRERDGEILKFIEAHMLDKSKTNSAPHILSKSSREFPLVGRDDALKCTMKCFRGIIHAHKEGVRDRT